MRPHHWHLKVEIYLFCKILCNIENITCFHVKLHELSLYHSVSVTGCRLCAAWQ